MTTTSIPYEDLAQFQRAPEDQPVHFECVRCQDGIAREDAAQGSDGVLCPRCAEHEIRAGGRVSFR